MQKKGELRSSSRKNIQTSYYASSRSTNKSMTGSFAPSRSTMGSRLSLASTSRKNLAQEPVKSTLQLLDDDGQDVTPQPLLQPDLTALAKNQSFMDKDSIVGSTALQQSLYGRSIDTKSVMEQPFSSSVFGSISDIGTTGSTIMRSIDSQQTGRKTKVEIDDKKHHENVEMLTDKDLDAPVVITLSETDTIWLLDKDSTSVAKDSEECEEVTRRNEMYKQLKSSREGNDRYVHKGAQTINYLPKSKITQTLPVDKKSCGIWATNWDIYDCYLQEERLGKDEAGEEKKSEAASRADSSHVSKSVGVSSGATVPPPSAAKATNEASTYIAPSQMIGASSTAVSTLERRGADVTDKMDQKGEDELDPSEPNNHPILQMDSFLEKLQISERIVIQNTYQQKQALYRGLPVVEDPDAEVLADDRAFTVHKPHLNRLWSYSADITKNTSALSLAWNKVNSDILAVGYGNLNFDAQSQGLICCWSLKNPEHPERVFKAHSTVTSLSFSSTHPNLLAAGLYDGNIALYNLRSKNEECLIDTRDNANSHFGPIWQVDWVEKERSTVEDRTEVLVSIGADGRVTQWSIRKGFEGSQLMRIKRPAHLSSGEKVAERKVGSKKNVSGTQEEVSSSGAPISQFSAGLGFDFWQKDSNIYLVGTEEGLIHKCSCSYNEQFLETYEGHTGSVYRIRWCPSLPHLFVSCSTDWSVRLWNQDHSKPLMTFTSSKKSLFDIHWCPWNPAMFATVSDSRVEVWDLTHNILDPYIVHKTSSGQGHCSLLFSTTAQVLLVGDTGGKVSVYQMRNVTQSADPVSGLISIINKEP